jgi:hypothetical protein
VNHPTKFRKFTASTTLLVDKQMIGKQIVRFWFAVDSITDLTYELLCLNTVTNQRLSKSKESLDGVSGYQLFRLSPLCWAVVPGKSVVTNRPAL